MGYYSVRLLIRCIGRGQSRERPLFEDRIVLVRANNHTAAKKKARQIANRRSVPYKNALGNLVRWRVARVCGSTELFEDEFGKNGTVKDGLQVYWRYIRSAHPVKRLKREGTINSL